MDDHGQEENAGFFNFSPNWIPRVLYITQKWDVSAVMGANLTESAWGCGKRVITVTNRLSAAGSASAVCRSLESRKPIRSIAKAHG
jgi:hypothetical protein